MATNEREELYLEKLVMDVSELEKDKIELMLKTCNTPAEINIWIDFSRKITKLSHDLDDYIWVRKGREPIFDGKNLD